MRYAIELTPDDNGTVMATCRDLPEVTSFGEDEDIARMRAVDAVEPRCRAGYPTVPRSRCRLPRGPTSWPCRRSPP